MNKNGDKKYMKYMELEDGGGGKQFDASCLKFEAVSNHIGDQMGGPEALLYAFLKEFAFQSEGM